MEHIKLGELGWHRFDIKKLRLGHTTSLMILQGQPLSELFAHGLLEIRHISLKGPFIFLKGSLTPFHQPPLCLKDIVLGQISFLPKEKTPTEALSEILSSVLT